MTNDNKTYKIILLGALPGVVDVQAQAGFAKLFKLPPEKVEQVFAKPRRVLKSGLTYEQAQKYMERLSQVGVACEVHEQERASESVTAPETGAATPPPPPPAAGGDTSAAAQPEQGNNQARDVAFEFTGNGFEYFKIWIVNILLSIVTLGIYSAWAKVRNKQYFYGNTYLDDVSFSYTADPVKILIGRIIAFVFLLVYTFAGEFSILAGIVVSLLLFIFLPWVMCKSLRFNARYSSYRNVPFAFNGRLGEAAIAYILWPILAVITLGILAPMAYYQQKKFVYGEHAYGTSEFDFSAGVGAYYKIFVLTFVIYAVLLGAAFLLGKWLPGFTSVVLMLAAYLFAFAYFVTAMANVNYNAINLREHRLKADWPLWPYLWLIVTNTILILLTLGLFIPWAKVRTAQYKADHTSAEFVGDMEAFAAEERENVNALAESVGDLFDIEVGF
ncbi:YjgN family protein [Gilvimarinus sp. DA14]|uniref:YjgN family protein n=1 Tax=Gilvimarinus sp. DA14 TaxID=2956798 RepID=UPI0020B81187|nr:YjgN family protein [Gilvimarinus sp. DA14]UTF61316.1 YjgN family protein [Gilvimarinus sp. DA14]